MGFSALDGLVMSSRSGSLDPGVVLYLIHRALHVQCGGDRGCGTRRPRFGKLRAEQDWVGSLTLDQAGAEPVVVEYLLDGDRRDADAFQRQLASKRLQP